MGKFKHAKLMLILFVAICALLMVACDEVEETPNNEPNIEEIIDAIEMLPDKITKDDIEDVENVNKLYKDLTKEQRALVTNYEILEKALKDVKFLKNVDSNIDLEFEKIFKMLDEAIPSEVEFLEAEITLPSTYIYENDYQNINFRISWTSSDIEVIDGLGNISHSEVDTVVTMKATIKCTFNGVEKEYSKNVNVLGGTITVFDKKICVAYWYGKFQELTQVDYETIDVINYSFAQIAKDDDGNWYINGRLNNLSSFAPAKEKGIKLCLSLGGWHDDKSFWSTYAEAAKTDANRKAVAQAILDTMIKYNLDGVDMDWEYPESKDRTNFTLLMRQIKQTLKAYNPEYLITAAIPAGSWIGSRFDLGGLNDCLDYFYVMSYDMDDGMNCNHLSSLADAKEAVAFYTKSGAAKEKLVIGSAFYGRIYEGVSAENNGLGNKATAKDETSYDNIKDNYLNRVGKDVVKCYDEKEEAYYLYDKTNSIYITYEDVESVTAKWDYVMESGIGGLMYWSYNNDKSNTLMTAIHAAQQKYK